MGIYRTSYSGMNQKTLYFLNQNTNTISNLQEKLASGRQVNRMSDSPLAGTKILNLSRTLSKNSQYEKNINTAISETTIADAALTNSVDLIHRAKELATQAANFGNDNSNFSALATEVGEIINQMVQIGNTNVGGRYLFGGKQTQAAPFTQTGNNVTYSGNAPTDAWQRQVEVSESTTLTYNANGENVFGQATVTAVGPPVVFAASSNGLFETLTELKLNMEAADPDEVRLRLDELDTDLTNVLNQQSSLGSTLNRLEQSQTLLQEREIFLSEQHSTLQDIDLPRLVTELSSADNALQLSLSAAARVVQPTLLNYLS